MYFRLDNLLCTYNPELGISYICDPTMSHQSYARHMRKCKGAEARFDGISVRSCRVLMIRAFVIVYGVLLPRVFSDWLLPRNLYRHTTDA